MKKEILFLLYLVLLPAAVRSQHPVSVDTLVARIDKQREAYPQEKIHVTTDRNAYVAGDTVWMRLHVADAATHRPVAWSRYAYVELKNPFDSVALRVRIPATAGKYIGYLPLEANLPEGEYTLTAHTMFMDNAGPDYHFRRTVRVTSPVSYRNEIRAEYDWKGERLEVRLRYVDTETGKPQTYDKMWYATADGETHTPEIQKDGTVRLRLKAKQRARPYILVGYGHNHRAFLRLPSQPVRDFDVSFYPEGGYAVVDETCRMAFKALNADGQSIDVSGRVYDDTGTEVSSLSTLHAGMGEFLLTPKDGRTYHARVTAADGTEKTFALPETRGDVAVVGAICTRDTLVVTAKGKCPEGSFFLILQRGTAQATAPADRAQGFSPKWFSDGIAQILLVSPEARVLSERLVFLHAGKIHLVKVNRDKSGYAPREAVRLALSGIGARSSVAVSVTDSGADPADNRSGIAAQLLLQGDLKGRVEHPAFYLTEGHLHELDLLMMTQGWRRYNLPEVLAGNISNPKQPLEQGLQLCGTVRSLWRNRPQAGINVSALSPERSIKAMAQTDGEGRFALDVPDFPEGTSFVLQALRNDGKPEYNLVYEEYQPSAAAYVDGRRMSAGEWGRKNMSNPEYQRIAFNPSQREMLLPEVVVTERKAAPAMENLLNIMSRRTFDADYLKDNHITHIDEVLRKIAGLQIGEDKLTYRGSSVAIMLDGVIMENPLANKATFANFSETKKTNKATLANFSETKETKKSMHRIRVEQPGVLLTTPFTDLKESLPMNLVKRIDFIPPYMAVVFGSKGTGGGILSVTTKRGEDLVNNSMPLPMQVITPLGTQTPAEFYAPKYEPGDTSGHDFRTTLYWNPDVEPDENGNAVVTFYMPDNVPVGWNIVVEGLAEDGSVIELPR